MITARIDRQVGDGLVAADFREVEVLEYVKGRNEPFDHAFLERFRRLGHGHAHTLRAEAAEDFQDGAGCPQFHTLEIGKLSDRRLAHDLGRGRREHGQHLDALEFLGLILLEHVPHGQAGDLGGRECHGQVQYGHGRENAGVIGDGNAAYVGLSCLDAAEHVLGTEQGGAGEGLDGDFTIGPFFHFGFPAFHLDAWEGLGGREIGVCQHGSGHGCRRHERGKGDGRSQHGNQFTHRSLSSWMMHDPRRTSQLPAGIQ